MAGELETIVLRLWRRPLVKAAAVSVMLLLLLLVTFGRFSLNSTARPAPTLEDILESDWARKRLEQHPTRPHVRPTPRHIIDDVTKWRENDEQYLHVLQSAKIIDIEDYSHGFSEKYRVHLEGGYVAAMKPAVETEPAAEGLLSDIPSRDFFTVTRSKRSASRGGFVDRRLTQGWAEIAAYHVDRVFGFNRKVPVAGRILTNHEFYAWNDSLVAKYRRIKDTYEIPVSLTPWIREVKSNVPTVELGHTLYLKEGFPLPRDADALQFMKLVSDTIVFDYLVDDHDRHNTQNWRKGTGSPLLLWDSGLSFLHGPDHRSECERLLCGPRVWREEDPGFDDINCEQICCFSASTMARFENMTQESIAESMLESLRTDPLFPVFNLGLYKQSHFDDKVVRFPVENFLEGLYRKMRRILRRAQKCSEDHGEELALGLP